MKAIIYEQYGPPEVLFLKEIDKPVPAQGEVLIRVHAASVNPYDWHFLRGTPRFFRLFTGLGKPKSPRLGADVAGVVEAAGPGVTRFKPGDEVFGKCNGSFGEYACGKEIELALKPGTVTFPHAAALPIAAITALQALRDIGKVQRGQSVLINGASGGVGTYAVQIAKNLGAAVTGVCSTKNVELVRSLGVGRVIDYTREDFTSGTDRYDVIFDTVGNHSLAAIRRVLQPAGIFVACGGGSPDKRSIDLLMPMFRMAAAAPFTKQKLAGVFARVNTADLDLLGEMVATGKVTPVLDRSYPLAETADAIRYVESGRARGKVIVAVA